MIIETQEGRFEILIKIHKHRSMLIHKKTESTFIIKAHRSFSQKQMKAFFLNHLNALMALPSEFNYERYLEGSITLFNKPLNHTFKDKKDLNRYLKNRLMTEIKRLEAYYKTHQNWIDLDGLSYEIKYYKSRFGSCHPHQRIIRFNQILVHYDIAYLEYIYVHEIAHLNEQNHQKGFYHLLDQLLPDHQSISKSLKSFHATFIKEAL